MALASLQLRHIADLATSNSTLQPHWGYVTRILPCTNDAGSCAYLDAVYWMHDVSMLYTFVMWAVIGGIFVIFVTLRWMKPTAKQNPTIHGTEEQKEYGSSSTYYRIWRGIQASIRRNLLPESLVGFFGNVTRMQLLVLVILLGYLLVFSLAGIVYKTWTTPVKNQPNLFNTRTGLGGLSDRVGALAYALTPLTIALATRESILTLATGIPYQSFNFLHRWLGRVIFIQSFLHTLGWTLIEGRLYQPQPTTYTEFIKQKYIVWGCISLLFITFLYIFSLRRVIKLTGHEFFRKTHYIVAGLYLGACWGHWNQLACWMIASLAVWGIDRGIRLLRVALIHIGYLDGSKGFRFHPAKSSIKYFDDPDGGVVRLEFAHNHDAWSVGQHFFLCFPALSIWQSHPFTVASVPAAHPSNPKHVYIIRCRKGETAKLKTLALELTFESGAKETASYAQPTTPVVLMGPYGTPLLPSHGNSSPEITNILAIAGGTGVSLTLPLVLAATSSAAFKSGAAIDFVWAIRRSDNEQWIATELAELKSRVKLQNFKIHIYVTQEHKNSTSETSASNEKGPAETGISVLSTIGSSSSVSSLEKTQCKFYQKTYLAAQHPSLQEIVASFLKDRANSGYRTRVIASGPSGMGHELRAAVASMNDGRRVLKGEKRFDVELEWDDRMG